MKRFFVLVVLAAVCLAPAGAKKVRNGGYPTKRVNFTDVRIAEDSFWGQRQKTSREVTIPYCLRKCEETERIAKFERAAMHNADTSKVFPWVGEHYDDSDVYKILEGVAYTLQNYPDAALEAYADSLIEIIGRAQEPDGYLMTARTMNPRNPHPRVGAKRWEYIDMLSHELYMLGHLCESAVAYYYATGKDAYVEIARKYADCVIDAIGPEKGKYHFAPGHQEAEIGLVKLYLLTGDRRYLDEAKYFLDVRYDHYSSVHDSAGLVWHQAFKPVAEQREAWGHCVKALYMYSGMTDVAAITGDSSYLEATDSIWNNIVTRKFYLTGGMGAHGGAGGESFGADYELPNASAYCETCAAIAEVFFHYRMFLLHRESKYYDFLEQTLYNAALSGTSLKGDTFFYVNPLESAGGHERQPWYTTACCPGNVARFIPSISQYIYATDKKDIYVNLYQKSSAVIRLGHKKVAIEQDTPYPWDGDISIRIGTRGRYSLKLRIPSWTGDSPVPGGLYSYCDRKSSPWNVSVSGKTVPGKVGRDGYLKISRRWRKGDEVRIHFDMEPRTVEVNEKVEADRGRIAVMRGPLVYCMEEVDNPEVSDVREVELKADAVFEQSPVDIAGYEVTSLQSDGLVLVPYYSWAHRGAGKMEVFFKKFGNPVLR